MSSFAASRPSSTSPRLSPLEPLKKRCVAWLVWLVGSWVGNRSSRRDIRAIKKGEKKTELFKWSEIDLSPGRNGGREERHFGRPIVCVVSQAPCSQVSSSA